MSRTTNRGLDYTALLGPALEHLLKALGELTAAAQAAIDALPRDARARHVDALRSGQAALALLGSMAQSGAASARRNARDEARREAMSEILRALDERAETLSGAAAEALGAVRDAVARAAGPGADPRRAPSETDPARTRSRDGSRSGNHGTKRAAPAARKMRRIPVVFEGDA